LVFDLVHDFIEVSAEQGGFTAQRADLDIFEIAGPEFFFDSRKATSQAISG